MRKDKARSVPKRSNPFQQLVLHLQRVLSPGCTVEESAMLTHRITQSEREVDVVIRSVVGEHTVVISVECIDQGRPADVNWIEQMLAKHTAEWRATDRLVLVSRSGFDAPRPGFGLREGGVYVHSGACCRGSVD